MEESREYDAIFRVLRKKFEWYESRSKTARQMERELNPEKKKTAAKAGAQADAK